MAQVGIFLPTAAGPGEAVGDVVGSARHAEDLGLESAWVVDQLVAGPGLPMLESVVALAAAAGATARIGLGLGVLVLPLRSLTWVAKQIAALQTVSGGRLVLGVGTGGARHSRSWAAAGVEPRVRGRRLDAALAVLPALVEGRAARVAELPGAPEVQLSPGAPMPPLLVGGTSAVTLSRAARSADGWFGLPGPPHATEVARRRLAELARQAGRPVPEVTTSLMVAITGDPDLPAPSAVRRRVADPRGMFGVPDDLIDEMLVVGPPAAVAERLAAIAAAGADRIVVSVVAGDWLRQAELTRHAAGLAM